MPCSFSVFRRKSRSPYFQVKFLDENGRVVATRSTGEKKHNQAVLKAVEMSRTGALIPRHPKSTSSSLAMVTEWTHLADQLKKFDLSPDQAKRIVLMLESRGLLRESPAASIAFVDWIHQFWDWDHSDYIREKRALGHRLTPGYCLTNQRHVANHYRKHFGVVKLADLNRTALKQFFLSLSSSGLSGSSVNSIMNCCKVALAYAFQNGLIRSNPAEGLAQVRRPGQARGILTEEEVIALLGGAWSNQHAAVGFLTALTCGLRAGEVLGLRVEDVGEKQLAVRRQWSNKERAFTPTKSKNARQAPLLPKVRSALLALAQQNPYGDGLVFWGLRQGAGRPCDQKVLVEGFYKALATIGITSEHRTGRNLVFHGLRHFYSVVMVDRVEPRKVALATGHSTTKMTEHYAAHQTSEHLEEVASALGDAFGFASDLVNAEQNEVQ